MEKYIVITMDYCEIQHVNLLNQLWVILTGRLSLTVSTGCWKGQENWCFHSVLSTTLSRYCSWLVCRLGLTGPDVSGVQGLSKAEVGCAGWAWAWPCPCPCVVDICWLSSPSPMAGKFLSLVPGPVSADMSLIPSQSSLGSLQQGKARDNTEDHRTQFSSLF